MDMITKMLGKKLGECIADGHKMCFVSHSKISWGRFGQEPSAKMHFVCDRCGYKDYRSATEKEINAIRTIRDAGYKTN